jgi:hypothetical protein
LHPAITKTKEAVLDKLFAEFDEKGKQLRAELQAREDRPIEKK